MRDLEIRRSQLVLSNEVKEGPVGIYAGLIGRNIQGIHRIVIAEMNSVLQKRMRTTNQAQCLWPIHLCSHVILEGNHRAVAHALLSEKIPCTILENNADVAACIELSENGKMSRFIHQQADLEYIIDKALEYPYNRYDFFSVSAYLKRGINSNQFSINKWPKYLRDQINIDSNS